jgi:hypothetical protein
MTLADEAHDENASWGGLPGESLCGLLCLDLLQMFVDCRYQAMAASNGNSDDTRDAPRWRPATGSEQVHRTKFGPDWFAFTSAIPLGQGRCSGEFSRDKGRARDVVQAEGNEFDNRMLQVKNKLRVSVGGKVRRFPLLYS